MAALNQESIDYKRNIVIHFEVPTSQIAIIILKALQPEASSSKAFGTKVQIKTRKQGIEISFETNRTTIMRALINSYLRWIEMILKSINVLTKDRDIQ